MGSWMSTVPDLQVLLRWLGRELRHSSAFMGAITWSTAAGILNNLQCAQRHSHEQRNDGNRQGNPFRFRLARPKPGTGQKTQCLTRARLGP